MPRAGMPSACHGLSCAPADIALSFVDPVAIGREHRRARTPPFQDGHLGHDMGLRQPAPAHAREIL